jgi:DNA-binding MarR family transcriptional regulator
MKKENVSPVSGLIGIVGSILEKANAFLGCCMKEKGIKDLLPAHGSILKALFVNNGKLRMNELAGLTGRSKSTVSELVSKLETAGYVARKSCDRDRRVNYVSLTPKSMAMEKDFNDISQQLIDRFSRGFSEDELEFLAKLLIRVRENF